MNKKVSQFDQLKFQQQVIREEYTNEEQLPPVPHIKKWFSTYTESEGRLNSISLNLTD